MKKIYGLMSVMLVFGLTGAVNAQTWLTSGSNIYYNLGNVGIGTASPSGHLSIYKSGGATFSMQDGTNSRFWFMASGNALQLGGDGGTSPSSGAISILNNGNVGIGTTAPTYPLDVNGVIQTNAGFHSKVNDIGYVSRTFNTSATGAPEQFYIRHNYGNVDIENLRGDINFLTDIYISGTLDVTGSVKGSSIGMTNIVTGKVPYFNGTILDDTNIHYSSDNVGIGTTNPSAKFHVYGEGGSGHILRFESGTAYQGLKVYGEAGSGNGKIVFQPTTTPGSGISAQYTHFKNSVGGGTTNHGVLVDGYLGVGTTTPQGRFHVSATGNTSTYLTAGSSSIAQINFGDSEDTNAGRLDYLNSDNSFRFVTGDVYTMTVQSGGNVGIGTTSPDKKLDVAGTIKSEEIIVEASGADFVFEEEYDLPTLARIEQFIKANKHLEGIASAKEMQANGVKVGEFQIKLLQKIEELTLHTIKQQKLIQLQAEALAIVQKQLKEIKEKK